MPVSTVWIVTRRPKRAFVGVAGGLKGAEELVEADAVARAEGEGVGVETLTLWSEHGEPPRPGRKFTRASVHVASRVNPTWVSTYDCVVYQVYQRPTPKTGGLKGVEEPEREATPA
jgi:hypothetical protein